MIGYHRLPKNLVRVTALMLGVMIPLLSAQHLIDDRASRRKAAAAVVAATAVIATDAARVAASAKEAATTACRAGNKNARELNAVLDYITNGIEAQGTDPATAAFLEAIPRPTIAPCPKG